MKLFIGITDNDWFDYLSNTPDLDEINFWRPSPDSSVPVQPGELFLFKLHSPKNYIAGGGVFAYSTTLPISLAWDTFGQKNGAPSFEIMKKQISSYRGIKNNLQEDFEIGCILLTQPFFFDKSEWFLPPDWSRHIQRGKTYNLDSETGKFIFRKVEYHLTTKKAFELDKQLGLFITDHARYGKETLLKPRLGQGSFKIVVTDAYRRSCAITQERVLPVLEAAHIKPYADSGPHDVRNGVLLRSDMHKLFDRGYLTITPKLHIEVSRRIREEFDNGEYYFTFHGRQINLPQRPFDQPSNKFLT